MSNQEHDPFGTSPHDAGAKLDAGKLRAALVLGDFSHALRAVAAVGTFGAEKYSPSGWLKVPNGYQRYSDAMIRHWLNAAMGVDRDADSGLSHLAHLAWNALAILEIKMRGFEHE